MHWEALVETYDNLEVATVYAGKRKNERFLLGFIELGNVSLAEDMIRNLEKSGSLRLETDKLSDDPVQHAQFSLVSSITLFCRAAVDSGLPEILAYSISDAYIRNISHMGTEEEIWPVFITCFMEYVEAVQTWRMKDCEPHLKICCDYIMSHVHSRITMQDLSDASHLSPNYISDLFFRELRIRPNQYIRKTKMSYAAYLLRNTDAPVSEIAALLAYADSSAMISAFSTEYGITPLQYRKKDRDHLYINKDRIRQT